MKPWPLFIGILFILAMFCAPALAISKSDLISQYKAGQFSGPTTPTPTPTPTVIPTTMPTQAPGQGTTFGTPDYSRWLPMNYSSKYPDGGSIVPDIPTPDPTPTVIPTPVPTQAPPIWSSPVVPSTKPIPTPTPASGGGRFEITSTPTGAPVYFDSVYKGVTPIVITGVSGSSHILRVTLGGIDYSTQITRSILGWSSPSGVHDSPGPIHFNVTKEGIVGYVVSPSFGKPNIYLYSDRDLTARVQLAPENAITVSEPLYQPGEGWRAEIRNGSLNGKGDFLFYEAKGPDYQWQKEEGYVIRASSREQDMASMLGPYGFNEKETSEFIEYWASHLVGDVDFVFYPQETDTVDSVMPLSVSPEPDHVMRIWFYTEPLITAPEPVTSPERIIREGFYVVEWGVIIYDEYWINHSPASSEVLL